MTFRLAGLEDLEATASFWRDKVDMTGDWIEGYLKRLILKDCFINFYINDQIVGTGGIRPSISTKSFANIGIAVSCDYRRQGLGTYIIQTLRGHCNEQGYKTICSTTNENIASQKTIEKSGYLNYHKVHIFEL
jgi:predicted acetyltransferase